MLPIKRSRDQEPKDTLKQLIEPKDLIKENKEPRVIIEELTANKRLGLLVSRLQNNYQIPLELKKMSFFPKINDKNGGFCLIYAKDERELHFYKSLLKNNASLKFNEFELPIQKTKDFKIVFDFLEDEIKKIYEQYQKISDDIDNGTLTKRSGRRIIYDLCEKVKSLSEEVILEFQDDLMLAFYNFENDEIRNCDWDLLEYSRKILFGVLSFIQIKVNNKQLESTIFFFQNFNAKQLIERHHITKVNEKAYIVDILYQFVFNMTPFVDEKLMYISLTLINFRENRFLMNSIYKSTLENVLHLLRPRYFQDIIIETYSEHVRKFTDSVIIAWLPTCLSGITLMNSTVVISSKELIRHRTTQNFTDPSKYLKSSESEEENVEGQLQIVESVFENASEGFAGADGFVLLTCIHEFAHFIQRSLMTRAIDWFSFKTPGKFLGYFPNEPTTIQEKKKIEAGKMLVEMIFGYEIEYLNHSQALFILNLENWRLSQEEFRENFRELLDEANPSDLAKYYPTRCKISSNSSLCYFGECGTSSGSKRS